MLTRLVYHSENHLGAVGGTMIADLNAILDVSNRNNEKAGITGALLFDTLWFVQILEASARRSRPPSAGSLAIRGTIPSR